MARALRWLFLAGAGVAFACNAQDWLVGSGLAKHLDGGEHCNSVTEGLGLEHGDYAVGFYRNSNCRWSTYAARAWMPIRAGAVRAGLLGGVVTGYQTPVMPAAAGVVSFEGERYGANLILVPPAGRASPGVAWLQWKVRW